MKLRMELEGLDTSIEDKKRGDKNRKRNLRKKRIKTNIKLRMELEGLDHSTEDKKRGDKKRKRKLREKKIKPT